MLENVASSLSEEPEKDDLQHKAPHAEADTEESIDQRLPPDWSKSPKYLLADNKGEIYSSCLSFISANSGEIGEDSILDHSFLRCAPQRYISFRY